MDGCTLGLVKQAELDAGNIRVDRHLASEGVNLAHHLALGLADGLAPHMGDEAVAINARHAHALNQAKDDLASAQLKLAENAASELLASDLRGALAALGEISGRVDNERMLDALFANFCIGK